ncbi:MarR family winged helix-turn-helix transcriptional regulator [Agromyces sp. MMS24-K17]|uniref:MarR family winged helix-turn-helix transcriptional regulator n=1 Tax=Agromyces sp. MMS24-K17 TaxID=3372850 RepID=UPI003753F54E
MTDHEFDHDHDHHADDAPEFEHEHEHDESVAEAEASTDRRPLGFWLKLVDRRISDEMATLFEAEGLTRRDWRALNLLGGDAVDEHLAHRLRHRPDLLDRLVERGWVATDEADVPTLTDAGREARDRLLADVTGLRTRVAGAVSPEDFATTLATLESIARELGWDESQPMPRGRRGGRGHRFGRFGHPHRGHDGHGHGHGRDEHGHGRDEHGHEHGHEGHHDHEGRRHGGPHGYGRDFGRDFGRRGDRGFGRDFAPGFTPGFGPGSAAGFGPGFGPARADDPREVHVHVHVHGASAAGDDRS